GREAGLHRLDHHRGRDLAVIRTPRTPRRAGFTLLELMIASLIAILLLSALYFTLNITLRQTQDGRDAVETDNLTRGVFNRMAIDLTGVLGPLPPKSGGNSLAGGGGGGSTPTTNTTTGTGTGTGTTGTDPAATGGTTTGGTTSTDPTATAAAAPVAFQAG